jgi:hypothetical protein
MKQWIIFVAVGVCFLLIAASGKTGGVWWPSTQNRRLLVAGFGVAFILFGVLLWRF